jgi:hypothetical protein
VINPFTLSEQRFDAISIHIAHGQGVQHWNVA